MSTADARQPIKDFDDPWDVPETHEEVAAIAARLKRDRAGPNVERPAGATAPMGREVRDALLLCKQRREWWAAVYHKQTKRRHDLEQAKGGDPSFGFML
jgi:hypothetical protein